MSSIIEFNGRKYDSITGNALSHANGVHSRQINTKQVFKPQSKSLDGVVSVAKQPSQRRSNSVSRQPAEHKRKVEKPKTLMRTSVKKPTHKPAPEHKAPPRVGLSKELTKERARRARHIAKSKSITKFSKSASYRRSDVKFTAKPLPVAVQPHHFSSEISTQADMLADKFEQAIQSAESHLEVFTGKKVKSGKSRVFAYAFASFVSVFLIGFAVYQAVPFVQVKMASNNAGFAASLPGYAPSGYGLENNLKADSGVVTMTYSSEQDNKNYKITQTPSQWNSDSLFNNYVLPASSQYERIDENGQTVYLYDGKKSATWLDNGIWYRLDGANNFSNDQLVRIVQGL